MNKICLLIIISFFLFNTAFTQSTEQYELTSINFEGNSEFSSAELQTIIYSEESPGWFWQFLNSFTSFGEEAVYFDSSNIPIDMSALQAYYNANGFFEAGFSYRYEVDSADKEVDLTYIISEGDASTFGDLKIFGVEKVPGVTQENFLNEVSFDTNAIYRQSIVQSETEQGINILLNSGYMLAQFDSTIIIRDTVNNEANIDIYFSTGKRYNIDTVIVEKNGAGASEVSSDLLREITDIEKGDLYSLEKIRQRQARLFRTGLFNSVILSAEEKDTTDSVVPLKLSGTIGLMNELSPEIILNTQNTQNSYLNVGLSVSYIRKNFLGNARKLTISPSFGVQDFFDINYGRIFEKFSIRDTTLLGYVDARMIIEQPYLFSKPVFGTWENYAQINKQREFNLTTYGSRITFEFELPKFTFFNFLSTYYNIESVRENYYRNNDSLSSKLISVIGADFGRITANNILFPTSGYNLSFQIEEANSLPHLISQIGSFDFDGSLFYKFVVNGSYYFSLNFDNTSILAMKTKAGYMQAYVGDYSGIPLNRTFYVGGSNSVRGWRSYELHPLDAPIISNIEGRNVKGGTFLLESSLELRYRLMESFGIALFYDVGNTWIGYKKFRYDELAQALGFGFRYYTQIAPFRIDFGFKFYDPEDKEFIWNNWDKRFFQNLEFHFGIGEAF